MHAVHEAVLRPHDPVPQRVIDLYNELAALTTQRDERDALFNPEDERRLDGLEALFDMMDLCGYTFDSGFSAVREPINDDRKVSAMSEAERVLSQVGGSTADHARRFHLQRDQDATGTSGTGRVADGVVFVDGAAALRWRTAVSSTAVYDSISDLEAIHGHGGLTRVVFDDE